MLEWEVLADSYSNFTLIHTSTLEDSTNTLQNEINRVNNIAKAPGFRFSLSKTTNIHFCRLRSEHPDPILTLDGKELTSMDEDKLLGVIFDRKLNWKQHIEQLIVPCQKLINIMKCLLKKR